MSENEQRAERAGDALRLYAEATRYDGSADELAQVLAGDGLADEEYGRELVGEVVSDLVCDLLHLANRHGYDGDRAAARAFGHYGHELAEGD